MTEVRLSELIAPGFYDLHHKVRSGRWAHFWLKGGRGSTKSSFASIEIILGMMADTETNAVVLRKVADTMRDSVLEQYMWAVEKLGVAHLWKTSLAPMRLTYLPTGQRIVFRGADDPGKTKSIKFSRGNLSWVHYEEVTEFSSPEEIRSFNQSLIRGVWGATVFYSYNPPSSSANWVNVEVARVAGRTDTVVHHSDYRTVPRDWLGEAFVAEAEHLLEVNPRKYDHEYLGNVTGSGDEVFANVVSRRLSDRQVGRLSTVYRGLDFGFSADPTAYVECYYNKAKDRLVIFDEHYQIRLPTRQLAERLLASPHSAVPVIADSAEPRTVHELRGYGVPVQTAKKGPGSVEHGIKWMADLAEIIVDPVRCPNALRELTGYVVKRDRHGNLSGGYPDKDNHTIDAVRYATEAVRRRWVY